MNDLEKHVAERADDESAAPASSEVNRASRGVQSRGPASRALPTLPQSSSDGRARRLANGRYVTTLTLSSRTCRWPIGDPTEADFHYCGQRPESSGPYCEAHERKSYQASTSRSNHRPRSR
jgi:GcrA cell cycle regulator